MPQIPPDLHSSLACILSCYRTPIAFGILKCISFHARGGMKDLGKLTLFAASIGFGPGAFVSTRPWIILGRRFGLGGRATRLFGHNERSSTPRRTGGTQSGSGCYDADQSQHFWVGMTLLRCIFEHEKKGVDRSSRLAH